MQASEARIKDALPKLAAAGYAAKDPVRHAAISALLRTVRQVLAAQLAPLILACHTGTARLVDERSVCKMLWERAAQLQKHLTASSLSVVLSVLGPRAPGAGVSAEALDSVVAAAVQQIPRMTPLDIAFCLKGCARAAPQHAHHFASAALRVLPKASARTVTVLWRACVHLRAPGRAAENEVPQLAELVGALEMRTTTEADHFLPIERAQLMRHTQALSRPVPAVYGNERQLLQDAVHLPANELAVLLHGLARQGRPLAAPQRIAVTKAVQAAAPAATGPALAQLISGMSKLLEYLEGAQVRRTLAAALEVRAPEMALGHLQVALAGVAQLKLGLPQSCKAALAAAVAARLRGHNAAADAAPEFVFSFLVLCIAKIMPPMEDGLVAALVDASIEQLPACNAIDTAQLLHALGRLNLGRDACQRLVPAVAAAVARLAADMTAKQAASCLLAAAQFALALPRDGQGGFVAPFDTDGLWRRIATLRQSIPLPAQRQARTPLFINAPGLSSVGCLEAYVACMNAMYQNRMNGQWLCLWNSRVSGAVATRGNHPLMVGPLITQVVHAALILPPPADNLAASDALRDARTAVAAAGAAELQATRAEASRKRGLLRHRLAAEVLGQQLKRKIDPSVKSDVPARVCGDVFAVDALMRWQSDRKSAALLLVDDHRFRRDDATGAMVPDGAIELLSAALRAQRIPLMLALQRNADGTLKSAPELAAAIGQQLVAVQAPVHSEAMPKADYLAAVPLLAQHARVFDGGALPAPASQVAFTQLANAGHEGLALPFADALCALAELRVNVPDGVSTKLANVLDMCAQRLDAIEFIAAFDAAARLGIPGKHGAHTAMKRVHAAAAQHFWRAGGLPVLHALRAVSRHAAPLPERAGASLAAALPRAAPQMAPSTAAACLWHAAAVAHAAAQQQAPATSTAVEAADDDWAPGQLRDCSHALPQLDVSCLYHRLAQSPAQLDVHQRQHVWAASQVLRPPQSEPAKQLLRACQQPASPGAASHLQSQLETCLQELLPQQAACEVRTAASKSTRLTRAGRNVLSSA